MTNWEAWQVFAEELEATAQSVKQRSDRLPREFAPSLVGAAIALRWVAALAQDVANRIRREEQGESQRPPEEPLG